MPRFHLAITMGCLLAIGQVHAGQWIVGSASIRDAAGRRAYGDRLSVFLVRAQNPVSADLCLTQTHPQRRLDCLNNRHLDFYKRFQEQQGQPGYLVAQTVTSETGNFAFLEPPAGDFFVLIMFPAMIDGYKVAWQEPVTVAPDRISVVTLDENNLVLPQHRRR
jgi:hypothetical protein